MRHMVLGFVMGRTERQRLPFLERGTSVVYPDGGVVEDVSWMNLRCTQSELESRSVESRTWLGIILFSAGHNTASWTDTLELLMTSQTY
jgi:hypothetical protein